MPKLFVVSTPIGNLEDITYRAVKTLENSGIIACEDTRRTRILLDHYKITGKSLVSFYSYNQQYRIDGLIESLRNGKSIALVSDSGTPCISDPGYMLVKRCIDENIPVEVIPGPSALVTALVGSGLPTNSFVFLGFLPKKSGKMKKALLNCAGLEKTIIFYESPFRIASTLETCREAFVDYNVNCVIARELTKIYEEYIRGSLDAVIGDLKARQKIKGEIIALLFPQPRT